MNDRSAASARVVLAALALAVVGHLGVGTAGVLASGGRLAGTATPSPWRIGFTSVGGPALVGSALVGVGVVLAAYGDGEAFSAQVKEQLAATVRSLGIGVSGLAAMVLWGSILLSFVSAVVPGEPGRTYRYASSTVALGLGSGTVALGYFFLTEKTASFLDVRVPTKRDLGYAVVGLVALLVVMQSVSMLFGLLGVSVADHSVEQVAAENPEMLLLLVPAAWLVIGPGEELIYRNIIQKELYDVFSPWGAVAVGSVVFALVHIPTYAAGASSVLSVANTLAVIFALSLVLGATYLRTDNLVVPILVHGAYDALSFLSMYRQITGETAAFLL